MTYREAIAWLYGTQLHGIKLGLENMRRLSGALGLMLGSDNFRRFVHVAGTNGKGSTCAMIAAISQAAGRKTALFTSPHLVTFRERIRINGALIPEENVARGLSTICEIVRAWEHSPTFFEITTALALAWFQECRAEIIVLETGMGGRLDATNVVQPSVSVLTPIDLDHQQWLGATMAEIALEKAGIIKRAVPVVSAPQHDVARCVIAQIAWERSAPCVFVDAPCDAIGLALDGAHQRWNAALAVRALDAAGIKVDKTAIRRGLREVEWPGRFHRITERLVLDGAHNPAAAQALAATWQQTFGTRKATLIFGMLADKDIDAVWRALRRIAGRVVIVAPKSPRALPARDLARQLCDRDATLSCEVADDFPSALRLAAHHNDPILVTGSLFLVGEALAHLQGGARFESSAQ